MVDRRDQVLIGFLSPEFWAFITFFIKPGSTKKPFFIERVIVLYLTRLPFLLTSIWELDGLDFLRVGKPLESCPHGELGCPPPDVLPSPPPIGWSTGFMATPRTLGLRPFHRLRPAFPIVAF